ncbi:TPA: DUF3265 domain-containing protein, partial [Vibrio vulnificus]|nr:DUF3265 domain-containing protein [Vibrio vulnificus]
VCGVFGGEGGLRKVGCAAFTP